MKSIASRCLATGGLLVVALLLAGSVTGCSSSTRVAANSDPYDRTLIPIDGPTSSTQTSSAQTIGGKGKGISNQSTSYVHERAVPPPPPPKPPPPPPVRPPPPPPRTPHSPR